MSTEHEQNSQLLIQIVQDYQLEPGRTVEELHESGELLENLKRAKTDEGVAAALLALRDSLEKKVTEDGIVIPPCPLKSYLLAKIEEKKAEAKLSTDENEARSNDFKETKSWLAEQAAMLNSRFMAKFPHLSKPKLDLGDDADSVYSSNASSDDETQDSPSRDSLSLESPLPQSPSLDSPILYMSPGSNGGPIENVGYDSDTSSDYRSDSPHVSLCAVDSSFVSESDTNTEEEVQDPSFSSDPSEVYQMCRETAYTQMVKGVTNLDFLPEVPIRTENLDVDDMLGRSSLSYPQQKAVKKAIESLQNSNKLDQGYLTLLLACGKQPKIVAEIKKDAEKGISFTDLLKKYSTKATQKAPLPAYVLFYDRIDPSKTPDTPAPRPLTTNVRSILI